MPCSTGRTWPVNELGADRLVDDAAFAGRRDEPDRLERWIGEGRRGNTRIVTVVGGRADDERRADRRNRRDLVRVRLVVPRDLGAGNLGQSRRRSP